jgi:hypothetical protein
MQWGAAGGRGVYNLFAGNRKNILNKQQGFATQLASASRSQEKKSTLLPSFAF